MLFNFPFSFEFLLPVLVLIFFLAVHFGNRSKISKRNWSGLDLIKKEYEPLVKILKMNKSTTYLLQVERIVDNLMLERDKIEKIKEAAHENSLNIVETGPLAKQAANSLRNIRKFIMRCEDNRSEAISLFRNLRLTMLSPVGNNNKVSSIMQQISNMEFLVEKFDSTEEES